MDATYLKDAAESYDFAKGFFQPTDTEIMGSAVQNFGILLSTLMQQRLLILNWDKFDPVSYFMHFFLGVAFSSQHSDTMREKFKIDKIFWRFEGRDKLKMYVSSVDGSKKKLMMKCISFGENRADQKFHDWSDSDFLEIISKIGTDLKSYEIESHHYELKFLTETEASAGTIIRKRGFFIITHYDRHIKVKPSLIKRGQKPSPSRLNEIKPAEAEAQDSINMDDHFDGMLSEPEQEAKVKTSAKKFVSHVIEGFKTQFKLQTGTASPSTCGFVHGSLLPFQKEYDFFAEASQIPNIENPLNQYDIFLNKKFTSSYKRLTPDYPIIFYILDADKSMNQIDIQKNLLKVLLEHSRKRKIELPQKSLAQKALITYVNSNTEKETIRQIDMPTLYTKNFDLRKHLTEIANALHQGGPENQKKAKEIEHSLKWELENPILSDNLIKKELCTKNSRCLSNYIHGMFSGEDKSAYIVKSDLETGEAEGRRTNFLLETDNRDLQVMLRVHEYDYTPEGNKLSLDDEINVPSLHEDSKVVAVINVVVPYSDETISEWETPDIEISSSVKKVNPNKEFQIEKIEQLNLVRETPFLSHADGTVSKSPDEAKKFLQHAGSQFVNFEDYAAFFTGCFHQIPVHINIARPSSNTMQIAYIINPDVAEQKLIVIANFIFGNSRELATAVTEIAKFHAETKKHKVAGKRAIVSYATVLDPKTGAKKTDILNEKHLSDICNKMQRSKRSICEYNDDDSMKRLKEREKIPTSEFGFYKKVTFFETLGKISHGVMTGLMLKSVIADLVQGNYWGVAINFGFVLANIGASYASSYLMTKAGTLTEEGRSLLGAAFKSSAPFLARGASFLFVGYDLYRNVHSNDTSTENKVAVGADITYLSLDLAETAIEVAEAVGVIEGISVAGGPIFWAVGAAVMVGSDIYRAVKQVERIMAVVPLTGSERLVEGLRAFIGLGPSRVVKDKVALRANERIVQKLLPSITHDKKIKRYVTPLQSTQSCSWDKFIDLTADTHKFLLSAATPALNNRFSYFCSMTDYAECNLSTFFELWSLFRSLFDGMPLVNMHTCAGVAGIVNLENRRADHTYYELTDGRDYVRASRNYPNIFELGNGEKDVEGGDKDDIFLLIGNQNTGQLNGKKGSNLLSLARYKFKGTINITDRWLMDMSEIGKPEKVVGISNFDQIHGRSDLTDLVTVWCTLKNLNTYGGSQSAGYDKIDIPNFPNCWYNLTITLFANTGVINNAARGHFHYYIQKVENGHTQIFLEKQSVTAEHLLTFEYNFFDFSSVHTRLHLHPKKLIFTMYDNSTFTIETFSLQNVKIAFKDDVQFHLHNKHLVAVLTTSQNLTMVENYYAGIISTSTLTMIIHSKFSNETLTLSRSRHHVQEDSSRSVNIYHSDTNGKTHLKGNQHQNIFTISPYFETNTSCAKFHEVAISVEGTSKNLIDFSSVRRAVLRSSSEITFQLVTVDADSLLIHAFYANGSSSLQCDRKIGQIKIHLQNSTRNIVLMNKGPLTLKFENNHPYLESPPLHFNQSHNMIILSDHDIEENTAIIIDKNLGDEYVFYTHNGTLLLTNVHQSNDSCQMLNAISKDTVAVLIMDYSSSKVLQSIILTFNDVIIHLESKVSSFERGHRSQLESPFPLLGWSEYADGSRKLLRVNSRWVDFAAKFDLMKCLWQAIMKLPVLATQIMGSADPREDIQQSGRSETPHEEQANVDNWLERTHITLSPDGLTTEAAMIDSIQQEEGTSLDPDDFILGED